VDRDELTDTWRELLSLARGRDLVYPMATKDDFIAQMTRSGKAVVFRNQSYDAERVARLIPQFFFPVASEQDLMHKTLELLVSRGLLPVQALSSLEQTGPAGSEHDH